MDKFIFGVATSSYQIEGTHNDFTSIWDTFSKRPGAITDQSNGVIACDHLNKYEEDINLIKELGVDSYRLSISWARVQPSPDSFSEKGFEFYKTLCKRLIEENIKPMITLYHWDMPQWVMDQTGGFKSKDIIPLFLKYAKQVFQELDGLFYSVATINEPFCVSAVSYLFNAHAPGEMNKESFIKSQYYTLLAHGVVADYYKTTYHKDNIGIVLNLWYDYTKDNDILSLEARDMSDIFHNKIYLEPLFYGRYPKKYLDKLINEGFDLSFIKKDELKLISTECGFLGINYYTRNYVKYEENTWFKNSPEQQTHDITDMGWEVYPEALRALIKRLRKEYTTIPVYITENGAAYPDEVIAGKVNDLKRITYFEKHLSVIKEMKDDYNIKGYYIWSLMDNFEWAFGYEKRFGIIYVDYNTQQRIKKESYYYLQEYIKNNR